MIISSKKIIFKEYFIFSKLALEVSDNIVSMLHINQANILVLLMMATTLAGCNRLFPIAFVVTEMDCRYL